MARRFESSRYWVDPQRDDTVRFLIGYEQKPTRWINCEITRSLALSRCMFKVRELARGLVDCENYDAIVPSV